MNQESKLVPVEPTEEMSKAGMRWLTGIQHMRVGDKRNALNEAFKAMLAAAHVPPAGGEVEVLGWLFDSGPVQTITDRWDVAKHVPYSATELVDRVHVTRLQADLADARSYIEFVDAESAFFKKERDLLQSELTKARELLSTCNSGFKDFISDPVIRDIDSFLAHQSAPAACWTPASYECPGDGVGTCKKCPNAPAAKGDL